MDIGAIIKIESSALRELYFVAAAAVEFHKELIRAFPEAHEIVPNPEATAALAVVHAKALHKKLFLIPGNEDKN